MPLNSNQPERISNNDQKKIIKLKSQKTKETKNEKATRPVRQYNSEELTFALDIGTRTVIGIVGIQEDDKFKVLATEIQEHKSRSMLDGQIHDVNKVAEITKEVKDKLEKKLGTSLSKVAIAAAGRVLKTCEVKVERDMDKGIEIDHEIVSSLEMEALQKAQLKLDEDNAPEEKTQFYCVGYSVVNYYINGYIISSLLGHKAKKAGIEVLATFLPHIVVDSLYTVMSKVGLEVVSLTLEPIAAINVTIPKDLRMLNLALVDIGAGTSDIAITKDGTVIAYAMAPVAGDEITEKISQQYLVDFNTAEKIKTSLSTKVEEITFIDILGKKNVLKTADIIEAIKTSLDTLADTISKKIIEYNHKAPNAVFLIGGGSQIPGLTEAVAQYLNLPHDRVVVRGREVVQNIRFSGKKLSGPESITPIGIAVTAQMQKGHDFLTVTVNEKKVRLFNSRKLMVADALTLLGFNPGELIGRTGKSLSFELNGVKKTIRGEHGKIAEIYINGEAANLESELKDDDVIRINPAEDGKEARAVVSDYIRKAGNREIVMNGSTIDISAKVYINNEIVPRDSEINDGDTVIINEVLTLRDLIDYSEIEAAEYDLFVNGKLENESYLLKENDEVKYKKKEEPQMDIEAQMDMETDLKDIEEIPSGQSLQETGVISVNEEKLEVMSPEYMSDKNTIIVEINGSPTVVRGGKPKYIFVDMFNHVDFDLSKPQGEIVLKLNGKQAAYTDPVKPGDAIEIYWKMPT